MIITSCEPVEESVLRCQRDWNGRSPSTKHVLLNFWLIGRHDPNILNRCQKNCKQLTDVQDSRNLSTRNVRKDRIFSLQIIYKVKQNNPKITVCLMNYLPVKPMRRGWWVYPHAPARDYPNHTHPYPPSFPSRSMTPRLKTGPCHTSGLYEDKFLNNFHQIKLSLDSYNKLMAYFASPL